VWDGFACKKNNKKENVKWVNPDRYKRKMQRRPEMGFGKREMGKSRGQTRKHKT